MKCKNLSNLCSFVNDRISVATLSIENYISTENMLQNKAGISISAGLPTTPQTLAYEEKDVLVSNIRPYFKKIWLANRKGGCSNDVLVMRANSNCNPNFLYYVLSDDNFFDHATATAKGTKMPRGDKTAIMQHKVPDFSLEKQQAIANTLSCLDDKIELNNRMNINLEEQAQAIFKSWFVGNRPNSKLGDFFPVITGKKDANVAKGGIYPFFSCSQNILYTDDYSFDADAILLAGNGDFNVKVYKGKFEAYQRTYVLIPYDKKYLGFLYYAIKYCLNDITAGFRGSVIRFITKGNIENFELFFPTDSNSFDIFNSFIKQIAQNNILNTKLAILRDTLLPKLMSGEIEVPVAEEIIKKGAI